MTTYYEMPFKTLKTVQFLITYKHACRKFGQYSRGHDIIASLWSELFLGALCHSTWLDLKASCTRHMIMKEENLQTLGRRVRAMFNHCQYRHYLRDSLRGQALRHLYPWTHCYTVLNSKVFLMYTCANIQRLAWGILNCQIQQLCFVEWLSDDRTNCLPLSAHDVHVN